MSEKLDRDLLTKGETEPNVLETLATLSEDDKINIVAQSFIVGAGSIDAHNMYVYYLSKVFSLTPKESGSLLRQCFLSLSNEGKKRVIQAAYHQHVDIMKKVVKITQKTAARQDEYLGNREATIRTIEDNLPTILGNYAFKDITEAEEALFAQLPRDFSPSFDSPVVQTIRKISADRGYYDSRKWYQEEH